MADAEVLELDRLAGFPHPRETNVLFGQDEAERVLLEAYRSGRMPHAWLIGGHEGVGKATLAYRAAKFILSHPDPFSEDVQSAKSLACDPNTPVIHRIIAQAHPDLMIVRREIDPKKKTIPTLISVDLVREALRFFGSTSGEGGWRIAIVDVADDLNRNGANALLKMIEEPPERSIIFLLANHPARQLPTIRSRCRKLMLNPLAVEIVEAILSGNAASGSPDLLRKAAELSEGSIRNAMQFLDTKLLSLGEKVTGILNRLPDLNRQAVAQLADSLTGRDQDQSFDLVVTFVTDWIVAECGQRAGEGASILAPLAEVWEKGTRSARDVDRFNLDRRPFVISLFADLAEAVRLSRAA